MNDILKNRLLSFKNITEAMIEILEKEEYDNLQELLDKRDMIITDLNNQSYTEVEFRSLSEELKLMELEQRLTKLLNEKRHKIRIEMDKVNAVKKANNNYQRNFHPDSLFFNKKI